MIKMEDLLLETNVEITHMPSGIMSLHAHYSVTELEICKEWLEGTLPVTQVTE